MNRFANFVLLSLAFATICSGCKSPWETRKSPLADRSWMSSYKKPAKEKIEYGTPERLAVIWSDSVASASGSSSVRGFGGRFYFYDKDGKPVRVNGELSVYAFDDSVENRKTQADRVYKFRQEDLQSHFGETALGPSYSVWIPWDHVGGERKTIALMPIFKTAENQIVKSTQSINVLPGKTPHQLASLTNDVYRVLGSSPTVQSANRIAPRTRGNYDIQLASHTETMNEPPQSPTGRTTTIDVPRQLKNRLSQELSAASVISEVQAGASANISYGPRESTHESDNPAAMQLASSTSRDSKSPPALLNSTSDASTIKPRNRPVFGAPGAMK